MLSVAAALALALVLAPQATGRTAGQPDRSEPRVMASGMPLRLDPAPIIAEGVLLVPVRPLAEHLGASADVRTGLDGKRTIVLVKGGRRAELEIGSKTMIVDGAERRLPAAPVVRSGAAMVPLRAVAGAFGESVVWEPGANTAHIGSGPELPVVGTVENLREILAGAAESGQYRLGVMFATAELTSSGSASADSASSGSPNAAGSAEAKSVDYSRTNVQVEGVDEADWAKTDGRFIYQISGYRVLIADIRNPGEPRLAAALDYAGDEQNFRPHELYVSDGRLVVIGTAYRQAESRTAEGNEASPDIAAKARDIMIWPPVRDLPFTSARVYALGGNGEASLVRELEIDGHYVTSRMIGNALYLVANKSNDIVYPMTEREPEIRPQDFEPAWRDTAVSFRPSTIPLGRIRYFPDSPESGTLLIGAVNLDDAGAGMRVEAYLGSAGTVYASEENLYIAVSRYLWPENAAERRDARVPPAKRTDLYKFRLEGGFAVYAGQGSVPGHVLNQFSMDEYGGHFRIATTTGEMWAEGDAISKNNLYVLDEWLRTVGRLEGLAPGERIYSARFMGSRAYMVTFRNVDPLFAIDLSDPERPSVLGQLKIPGYSDYLHPYDENHLIGFGKETIEVSPRDGRGEPTAYYLGMKISLFDVTDVSRPKEKFKVVIGDRGTHSEVLNDHKALLFDRSRGLLAFPVELAEVKSDAQWDGYGSPPFGEFAYQGAWVYQVDLENGFTLKGRITHLSEEDLAKAGMRGYDYTKMVRRILYAGDTLYTLSDAMLKANALDTLAERGKLLYPEPKGRKDGAYPGDAVIYIR
jgi:uncharacterized secreted protein with C-terminal beta-propeller domain